MPLPQYVLIAWRGGYGNCNREVEISVSAVFLLVNFASLQLCAFALKSLILGSDLAPLPECGFFVTVAG
jgi:hypothetical protein